MDNYRVEFEWDNGSGTKWEGEAADAAEAAVLATWNVCENLGVGIMEEYQSVTVTPL